MKNGSRNAKLKALASSTSTPFKKYRISSETLYSEILMLITQEICEADDLPWRFQLNLRDEYNTYASLDAIEIVKEEVLTNMQIEVTDGLRVG